MGRKRSIPLYPIVVLLLIGVGGYLGCDPDLISGLAPGGNGTTASGNPRYSEFIPDRTPSRILIGSFNLQRLGPSKLRDDWVLQRYADIIRRFDVIAIQEITSQDQSTLPQLVAIVNQQGSNYWYTISPPIGRPALGYFEQYAFIFDTDRVMSGPDYCYVVQDQSDLMHREPFVGRFQTVVSGQPPFRFTLVNVHTDPDEIRTELDVLADVYRNVRQYEYPEDDVILLGDLNQAPGRLQQLEAIPGLVSLIRDLPTNTRKSKTLDNILVDRASTQEFTGRAGTLDMENLFGISSEQALKVSDHLPIWAEFTIFEYTGAVPVAGASSPILR
jgi:deoxyribonuclease-1-like protein